MTSSNILKYVVSCNNELQQELGFKNNHPLVLCIRCLRFINKFKFGRSIYNKDLRICCKCCNEEKSMQDKDWIEDLENMRETEVVIMNQKDYEKIARIIKRKVCTDKWDENHEINNIVVEEIAEDLADYFEKKVLKHRKKIHQDTGFMKCVHGCWCFDWNKQQFLKDCGVGK